MKRCIDAGKQGCPCVLAESGDCIICAKISGGSCDDCNWQGTCIYTLYEQNGRRLAESRQERILPILDIKSYGPNFKVFILGADRGFCQKAAQSGAFVFVKGEEDHPLFGAPISILKSEPELGRIHLGISVCGPKTSRLFRIGDAFLDRGKASLYVRGVYESALRGLSKLRRNPGTTYVFAKGIAIAPLRNLLDAGVRYEPYLRNLQLFVDLDKVGWDFFSDYFGDLPAERVELRDFAREGICSLDDLDRLEEDCLQNLRTNVIALASPYYVQQIQRGVGYHKEIVKPNEGNLCCGEGVCGACSCTTTDGRTVRNCKEIQ